MTWMETASGRQFDPHNDNFDCTLDDLLLGMARLCRFAGQIRPDLPHYSVAEHSVLLMRHIKEQRTPYSSRDARTVLLHDASEGLLGDVPRPIKATMPGYRAIESQFMMRLAGRFDFAWPMPAWLRDLDYRILVDERAQAMSASGHRWECDDLEPLGVTLKFWSAAEALEEIKGELLLAGLTEEDLK